MKRILVVPDSVWGNDSGHRSTQFLARVLKNQGLDVAVFAEDTNEYSFQKENLLKDPNIVFYPKSPYRYYDQFYFFRRKAKLEFFEVINDFRPDVILYFGGIRNKVSIDFLNSQKVRIPYYYLPLNNEFWCLKNFAGLKNGECFKCINDNFFHAWLNNCLESRNPLLYSKEALERFLSRKKFMNAELVLGYSESQIDTFLKYGLPHEKSLKSKVFFDRETVNGFNSKKGNYFLFLGQITVAKGWHFIPDLLNMNAENDIIFKFIIYKKERAEKFINDYNLSHFIKKGKIEIISGLESHKDVLEVIAESLAVIIPSNYPTTGEFTLLESMGLSKPVIAFNVGAHKDFLIDRQNALVSNVSDLDKMTKDIKELNADDHLWEQLSKNAFKTFKELTNFKETDSLFTKVKNL